MEDIKGQSYVLETVKKETNTILWNGGSTIKEKHGCISCIWEVINDNYTYIGVTIGSLDEGSIYDWLDE